MRLCLKIIINIYLYPRVINIFFFYFTGCEYGDRIESCGRYVQGLGRSYVCAKYSSYCCRSCAYSSASSLDQTIISDFNDKDKHIKRKAKRVQAEPKVRRKGKDSFGAMDTSNDIQLLETTPDNTKPDKQNELMGLFQNALKGLNNFFSNTM